MFFNWFIMIVILQRLTELMIAKSNENWMKERGAIEAGKEHYKYIVLVHILFLAVLIVEVKTMDRALSPIWPFLLLLFLAAQAGRVWAITSLGRYWNTKIIVLPEAGLVPRGPYKYLKHPNYVIVAVEIAVIPLIFQAYFTSILFTLLNAAVLSVRIAAEERALFTHTDYQVEYSEKNRFLPKYNKS